MCVFSSLGAAHGEKCKASWTIYHLLPAEERLSRSKRFSLIFLPIAVHSNFLNMDSKWTESSLYLIIELGIV